MIRLAAKHDLLVLLDPCETIDHLTLMLQNGLANAVPSASTWDALPDV